MRRVNLVTPAWRFLRPLACTTLAFTALLAWSSLEAYGLISVNQPWITPGITNAEAYMTLTSTDGATLVAAHSRLAAQALLRAGRPGRTLRSLALPAGKSVSLRAGGERIVLLGLAHPLKLGDRVPLTLVLEAAGMRQEIAVDAEVRNQSPVDAELRSHHH
jgi:copper(I)-binding protein